MTKELKERIFTSILLISLLVIMFINKLVLLFFLILIYVLSFLEFANITKKIFTKKKQLQFIFNLIFLTYFFIYLTIFFFLNDVFSLKIFQLLGLL